jgi:hypothetical protein
MAANKQVRFGAVALTTTTTTNVLNPPTLTGGVVTGTTNTNTYFLLKHIRLTNKTTGAVQAAMWVGATGANTAGTEFAFPGIASAGALTDGISIAAQSYVEWFGNLRLDVADFLVGGANTATAVTFEAEGEIGIA